jgi:hypothetical protein
MGRFSHQSERFFAPMKRQARSPGAKQLESPGSQGENAMKIGMMRLGLSLMIVVSFWTSRLPAQEVFVVPETHYEPDRHAPSPGFVPVPKPAPADNHARRSLNHVGMGCQDDYYSPVCGSWRYEVRFIFGSCHSFFETPCAPFQPCADRRYQR